VVVGSAQAPHLCSQSAITVTTPPPPPAAAAAAAGQATGPASHSSTPSKVPPSSHPQQQQVLPSPQQQASKQAAPSIAATLSSQQSFYLPSSQQASQPASKGASQQTSKPASKAAPSKAAPHGCCRHLRRPPHERPGVHWGRPPGGVPYSTDYKIAGDAQCERHQSQLDAAVPSRWVTGGRGDGREQLGLVGTALVCPVLQGAIAAWIPLFYTNLLGSQLGYYSAVNSSMVLQNASAIPPVF
jgi:hypothetical protein